MANDLEEVGALNAIAQTSGVGGALAANLAYARVNGIAGYGGSWNSGSYYIPVSQGAGSTNGALGNGTLRLTQFYVPTTVVLSRIGCDISGAGEAGSKFRMGIYTDSNGAPLTLVVDDGAGANGASATVQEVTISATLTAGWYWIGGAVQLAPTTQPTMRTLGLHPIRPQPLSVIPTANQGVLGYTQGGVTGALPGTFAGATSGVAGARLFLKVA